MKKGYLSAGLLTLLLVVALGVLDGGGGGIIRPDTFRISLQNLLQLWV